MTMNPNATTADSLWNAMVQDQIPGNPQTREDYGFSRAVSDSEESHLLGLFQGLRLIGATPEQVHQWRLEGSLVDKINEYYELTPVEYRGRYHPWFTKNQHLLRGPQTPSSPSPRCFTCHKLPSELPYALKHCATCRKTPYCSRECQKGDWKKHKRICTSPVTP